MSPARWTQAHLLAMLLWSMAGDCGGGEGSGPRTALVVEVTADRAVCERVRTGRVRVRGEDADGGAPADDQVEHPLATCAEWPLRGLLRPRGGDAARRVLVWAEGLDAPVKQLVVGSGHNRVTDESDQVQCWGRNDEGQLGTGETGSDVLAPPMDPILTSVRHVAASDAHSCAVDTDGNVYCWGEGSDGRLGTGDAMDHPNPTRLSVPCPS